MGQTQRQQTLEQVAKGRDIYITYGIIDTHFVSFYIDNENNTSLDCLLMQVRSGAKLER